jgi:hypothetical protein
MIFGEDLRVCFFKLPEDPAFEHRDIRKQMAFIVNQLTAETILNLKSSSSPQLNHILFEFAELFIRVSVRLSDRHSNKKFFAF